jgi:hypothetical protein
MTEKINMILSLPSHTPPVNGTKGDARHTITGKIVDDLKAIFDQPLTADERLSNGPIRNFEGGE